ncbi:hypothetical protein BDP55DRAFT_718113 [Colletotrichum godetiae]|uniref:Uncharacterized protein n=1 Tax=Colletotrichum godetiae TaxID=1209918 RepID=A0AAJ0AEK2_9PEZI|nr:uncharacterized protein BDP55DRAFT_718113 [Colletotrichum godetiae]KAK1672447.1 hypothetical protein BDP55DRAFT_718113 [Colletotrichum godetiae]
MGFIGYNVEVHAVVWDTGIGSQHGSWEKEFGTDTLRRLPGSSGVIIVASRLSFDGFGVQVAYVVQPIYWEVSVREDIVYERHTTPSETTVPGYARFCNVEFGMMPCKCAHGYYWKHHTPDSVQNIRTPRAATCRDAWDEGRKSTRWNDLIQEQSRTRAVAEALRDCVKFRNITKLGVGTAVLRTRWSNYCAIRQGAKILGLMN